MRSPPSRWIRGSISLTAIWSAIAVLVVAGWFSFRPGGDELASRPGDLRLGSQRVPAELLRLPQSWGLSDLVQWPGKSRLLALDDDLGGSFLVFPSSLVQSATEPEMLPLPPGAKLNDGEGLASDGEFLYALSSHALKRDRSERKNSLLRLRPVNDHLEAAGAVVDLKKRLEESIPELAAVAGRSSDEGGLNLEGLAWDPRRRRLLLGLRGPLFDGRPAVLPLEITPVGEPFDIVSADPPIIVGGIQGFGIRALAADPMSGGFLVLTGGVGNKAPGSAGKNRFALWSWSGEAGEPAHLRLEFPHRLGDVDLKPEGVCRVVLPDGSHYVLVVTDGSPYYWKIPLEESRKDS